MKVTLTLLDPEESVIVEFDSRDRRAFERAGYKALGLSGPLQDAIQRIPDSYVTWLAWHALKRQGMTTESFDVFDGRLVDMDPEGEESETDPTAAEI